MKKIALFAFNGEFMCFMHVLLNSLDMDEQGYEVRLIIEGAATKLIPELSKKEGQGSKLYQKVKKKGLIAGVCRACSVKMGVTKEVEKEELKLLDEMSGHPSVATYLSNGFEIMIF